MSLSEIKERLHQAGHKVTPQRLTIIKVVTGSNEHLTPAAIYRKVRRTDPEIGEVTVYRTLNILEEMGLVCLLHTGDNPPSYVASPDEHHGHIICSECGKVVNFLNCNLGELEERLSSETGFTINEHHLNFFGKCPKCREQTGRPLIKNQRGESS
ncbi:MAG: transcriptional repressor [Dehalococcoidales bacterium]|nr:transcriptional repressor [Dehalococcoidales bacterium]